MTNYLRIQLESDSCFASGSGFMGEVDTDIEREERLGLPVIGAKSLKGLLAEECSFILQAFCNDSLQKAGEHIFGTPGQPNSGALSLTNAKMPAQFRKLIKKAVEQDSGGINSHLILKSLTTIRYQTAIDRNTGSAREHSLRNTRVTLPGLLLHAPFTLVTSTDLDKALFAACVLSLHRGGLNRNRGWGRMKARIFSGKGQGDLTSQWAAGLSLLTGGLI